MDTGLDPSTATGLILISVGVIAYFLPALIAAGKNKRNATSILLVNLFFGWTVLGWLVALIWAASYESPRPERIEP